MPHIHDKIDFTVAIFIVQQAQVLLVHHRALDKWRAVVLRAGPPRDSVTLAW
jgi:hypothetical protein